jgi:hypothetical protein
MSYHMSSDSFKGSNGTTLAITVKAHVTNTDLLAEVLDETSQIRQILNIRYEETMSFGHVRNVVFKTGGRLCAEQAVELSESNSLGYPLVDDFIDFTFAHVLVYNKLNTGIALLFGDVLLLCCSGHLWSRRSLCNSFLMFLGLNVIVVRIGSTKCFPIYNNKYRVNTASLNPLLHTCKAGNPR